MVCSAERWVGEGLPRSSLEGWDHTGFEPVAIKKVKLGPAALAELDALNRVRDRLKGEPGPHHVTTFVELAAELTDAGSELLFITR